MTTHRFLTRAKAALFFMVGPFALAQTYEITDIGLPGSAPALATATAARSAAVAKQPTRRIP